MSGQRDGGLGRRLRALALSLWLCACMVVGGTLASRAAVAEPLALEGTWFVVVHFQDTATANPEAERWEDKVWTFERDGDRLEWGEYRIVVFQDPTGRFEAIPGNPRSRVLRSWWPNAAQREELDGGPRVNQRGSRHKELRGSPEEGWVSGGRLQVRSATAIGFQESVRIDGLDELPVFVREDRVGTATSLRAEGRTEYRTKEILGGGRELRGTYTKDGHRSGTFRMIRTPEPRGLLTSEEDTTVHERFLRRQREEVLRRAREAGDALPPPEEAP